MWRVCVYGLWYQASSAQASESSKIGNVCMYMPGLHGINVLMYKPVA